MPHKWDSRIADFSKTQKIVKCTEIFLENRYAKSVKSGLFDFEENTNQIRVESIPKIYNTNFYVRRGSGNTHLNVMK